MNIFKFFSELGLAAFEHFPFVVGFLFGIFYQELILVNIKRGNKNERGNKRNIR